MPSSVDDSQQPELTLSAEAARVPAVLRARDVGPGEQGELLTFADLLSRTYPATLRPPTPKLETFSPFGVFSRQTLKALPRDRTSRKITTPRSRGL
jgi:hypothetical protein